MVAPLNTSALLQVDTGSGPQTFAAGFTLLPGTDCLYITSHFSASASNLISGVTIGGTTATRDVRVTVGTTEIEIWRAQKIAGSSNNVVVTYSSGADNELSGAVQMWAPGVLAVDAAIDRSNTGTATSAAPAATTNGPLIQSRELIFWGATSTAAGNPAGLTVPSGYTQVFVEQNNSTHVCGQAAYKEAVGTSGNQTATGGITSVAWGAIIASYRLNEPGLSFDNSIHVGDGPSEEFGFLDNSVNFAATPAANPIHTSVAADTVTFTSTVVAVKSAPAVASDTVTFTSTAVAVKSAPAVASDTLSFTSTAVALKSAPATASDSITFTATAVALKSTAAVAVDSVTFADSAIASLAGSTHTSVAADTITFTSTAVALKSAPATASDSVSFAATAAALKSAPAVASDSVTFTSTAVALKSAPAVASDSITFTATAVASHGSGIHTSVAQDTIVFTATAVASHTSSLPNVFFGPGFPGWHVKQKRQPKQENRREELSRVITELYEEKTGDSPPAEVKSNPQAADPAIVGEKVSLVLDAIKRAVEDVRGDARVAAEIERARKAAEEELARVKQRQRNHNFLLLME